MPHLQGMYAPGNECAHSLPPAGFILPHPPDVFRFNRVAPKYPPDPNIRPNEGDLICPQELPPCPVNYPNMPAAGTDTRMISDVFRFHKVHRDDGFNPCKQPCSFASAPPEGLCTNRLRYPPSKPGRHFDYRYPAGETECNQSVHRHGHVPESCSKTLYDNVQPAECLPYGYNSSGQDMIVHDPSAFNENECMADASMYNNVGSESFHGGPKDFRSRGAPDPYAVTGNLHYNSSGYATDRCAVFPVNKGDKMVGFGSPCPHCPHPYLPSNYVCRPVYNRKYLLDCPEQDGPPANTYTFL